MMHYQAVWIVLLALNGSAAFAQTTQPARSAKEGAAAQTPSKDLLAGPKVDDEAARETDPQFGGAGRDRARVLVPPRQWFGLLRKLDLDEDQDPEIRRLVQSFQKAARAHQQTNGQRLRELQGQVREARDAGRDLPVEVRRELGKLRSLAPKPAAYQMKIWSLLTETQQETMRAGLAQIRQRIAERRAAQRSTDEPAMSSDRQPRSDAISQTDPDDRAQRRLRFLRSRQSPQIGPGVAKKWW
ncbi:MAG: hypothetical protein V3T84_17065 [Phycisphaerales bacterium]